MKLADIVFTLTSLVFVIAVVVNVIKNITKEEGETKDGKKV